MRSRTLRLLVLGILLLSAGPTPGQLGGSECLPLDPTILCTFYCSAHEGVGQCYGPAPADHACVDIGYGCVGAINECCLFRGGF